MLNSTIGLATIPCRTNTLLCTLEENIGRNIYTVTAPHYRQTCTSDEATRKACLNGGTCFVTVFTRPTHRRTVECRYRRLQLLQGVFTGYIMLFIAVYYRRRGTNLRAKLFTAISSLSANHAYLKTLYRKEPIYLR